MAVLGFALVGATWTAFDFLFVGEQSYLLFAFLLFLYYYRQSLIVVLFRLLCPVLFPMDQTDFMFWQLSVFLPMTLYLVLVYSGTDKALPNFKKKPERKRSVR